MQSVVTETTRGSVQIRESEAWGAIDGVCAALEGLAIVAGVGLLTPRLARRPLSASVGFGFAAFVVADAASGSYGVVAGGFAPGSGAHDISYSGLTGPGELHADRPMSLIYDGTSPTSRIVGLMYYAMNQQAPDGFAGPNDHWHRHSNVCINGGAGFCRGPDRAPARS
jgi:hypothetical protein